MLKKYCLLSALCIAMLSASVATGAANTMSQERLGDIKGTVHELLKNDTAENDARIAELVGEVQRASFTKSSLQRKAKDFVDSTRSKLDTRAKRRGMPAPVIPTPAAPSRPAPVTVPSHLPAGARPPLPTPVREEMKKTIEGREIKRKAAEERPEPAVERPAEGPVAPEVTEEEIKAAAQPGDKREAGLHAALLARIRSAGKEDTAKAYDAEYQTAAEGLYPAFRIKVEKVVTAMRNAAANQAQITQLIGEIRTDGYPNTANALNAWLNEATGGAPEAPAEEPAPFATPQEEAPAEEAAAEEPVIAGVGTPRPATWETSAPRLSQAEIKAELDWIEGQANERPLSPEELGRQGSLRRAAEAAEAPAEEAPAGEAVDTSTMEIEELNTPELRATEIARIDALGGGATMAQRMRKTRLEQLAKVGAGEAAKKEAAQTPEERAAKRLADLEAKEAARTLTPTETMELRGLRVRPAIEEEEAVEEEGWED